MTIRTLLVLAGALALAPASHAQTDTSAVPGGTVTQVAPADKDIEQVRSMLVGSWTTTTPDGDVHMHITPIAAGEVKDCLAVELCLGSKPHRSYRQSVMQLYRFKGKLRMRTLEYRNAEGNGAIGGFYAAPDLLPAVDLDTLIATQDMEFAAPVAGKMIAETPYPYPTARSGAVQMTSRLEISKDKLVSADRGFDASGAVVWGAGEKDSYSWTRFTPSVNVTRTDKGLVIIDFNAPEGEKAGDGDTLSVHYQGWLTDGTLFDSSLKRGQPFQFTLPAQVIEGFSTGVTGLVKGQIRRLYIPAALGYAERGGGPIPPNADLIFEVEVVDVTQGDPTPPAGPQGPDVGGGGAGGGGAEDGGGR